jgi:hypothetical protein
MKAVVLLVNAQKTIQINADENCCPIWGPLPLPDKGGVDPVLRSGIANHRRAQRQQEERKQGHCEGLPPPPETRSLVLEYTTTFAGARVSHLQAENARQYLQTPS